MGSPKGSDENLLGRLNALKPTTINLDPSSTSTPASTIEPAKTVSREDALSERLKKLRQQTEPSGHEQSAPPPSQAVAPIQGRLAEVAAGADAPKSSGPQLVASTDDGDVDPLLDTDDQTLEELLADLGSDDQWLQEVAAEVTAEEEHRRVTALLEELGKAPGDADPEEADAKDDKSDDESDGEHMTRDINDVLAQAVDEAELDKARQPPPEPAPAKPPSGLGTAAPPSSGPPDLPDVPADSEHDDDFVAEIASRMAALTGLEGSDKSLPAVPTSQVDELGLPAAPSFSPEDRPLKGVYKRLGYTDEDQKSWCIVCLEDGAIRCLDCEEGDIYCARCWKEMHVGPQAGYDERGHRWEKFSRHA